MRLRYLYIFILLTALLSACTGDGGPTATSLPAAASPTATAQSPAPATSTPPPPAAPSETLTVPPETTPAPTQPPSQTNQPTPTEPPVPINPPTPTQAPQTSPTPETPLPSPTVAASACLNKAVFVDDLTIPDGTFITQGTGFVKTWRVKNDGTCNWNENYTLVFAGGEAMNGPMSQPLSPAAPGESIDISIDLTAPVRGGSYTGNWWFTSDAGENFGVGVPATGKIWAAINVGFLSQGGQGNPAAPTPEPGGSQPAQPTQPAQPALPATGCPLQRDTGYEQQVLALINQGREAQGLPLLAVEPRLVAAALRHSNDMACNNWASHIGTDGTDWYARVAQAGYANYNTARENVWYGLPKFGANAEWFYNQMYNSPVHHDNMFFPTATQIGIAFVLNTTSEEGYITLVVARP